MEIIFKGAKYGYSLGRFLNGVPCQIEALALHVAAGTLAGEDEWVNNPDNGTAPHVMIGGPNGREKHQYIQDWDTAKCIGGNAKGLWNFLGLDDKDANSYTYNVEMEGGYKDGSKDEWINPETLDEASWLFAKKYLEHNLPLNNRKIDRNRIIGHFMVNQISRTNCPFNAKFGDPMEQMEAFRDMVQDKLNQLLPPPPTPVKTWKDDCVEVNKTFIVQKDVKLLKIDTQEELAGFLKGASVNVKYAYNDYYITEYSFNNNLKNGFRKADLEFVLPKPDVIGYFVSPGVETWTALDPTSQVEFRDEESAKAFLNTVKEELNPGITFYAVEWNETKNIFRTIAKRVMAPKQEPIPPVETEKYMYFITFDIQWWDVTKDTVPLLPGQQIIRFPNAETAEYNFNSIRNIPTSKPIYLIQFNTQTNELTTLGKIDPTPVKFGFKLIIAFLKDIWSIVKSLFKRKQ